jgi:hypothetical protein
MRSLALVYAAKADMLEEDVDYKFPTEMKFDEKNDESIL